MARLLMILILLWTASGDHAKPCSSPVVDLGILVDGSSNLGISEYVLTKRALVSLIQHLDVSESKTHVGVGYYSNMPNLYGLLSDDRLYDPVKLMLNILSLPHPGGGDARLDLALKMAIEQLFTAANGDRPSVPNVLIVVTGGKPGKRNALYDQALKQLQYQGTRVIVVGLGEGAIHEDLLEIALGERKQVFLVPEVEKLNLDQLSSVIKNC